MSLIRIPRSIESNVLMSVLKALIGDKDTVAEIAAVETALTKVKVINILRVLVDKKKGKVTVYVNRKKIHEFYAVVDLPRATPMRVLELLNTSLPKEIATSEVFNKADTILSRQGGGYWTFSGK